VTRGSVLWLAVALCAAVVEPALAQGVKRSILQRADVAGTAPKECVFGSAELAPGHSLGKHLHHGVEIGYVMDGEFDLLVDGEPPRHLKAGDSYQIAALRPHDARNDGAAPIRVVATWVVEKGKPLAEPVKQDASGPG